MLGASGRVPVEDRYPRLESDLQDYFGVSIRSPPSLPKKKKTLPNKNKEGRKDKAGFYHSNPGEEPGSTMTTMRKS